MFNVTLVTLSAEYGGTDLLPKPETALSSSRDGSQWTEEKAV